MKRIILSLIVVFFTTNIAFAQNKNDVAKIKFLYTDYNFGNIAQNSDGTCYFYYQNTGNKPLILSSVATSCGCTTPFWSKKPLLPNKNGKIKVKYNTALLGDFRKVICVKSNATNKNPYVLRIHGKVVKK